MHVVYVPDSEQWDVFFQNQAGGSPYFEGVAYRRGAQFGAGLGSAFAAFMRFLIPLAKKVGPLLAEEGLSLGSRLMGQVAEGEPLKQNLKKEANRSFQNLVSKVNTKFQQQGLGKQRRRKIADLSHSLVGKRLRKHAPLISSPSKYLDPFDS